MDIRFSPVRTLRNRHDEETQQHDWHPHPRNVRPNPLVRQDSPVDGYLLLAIPGSEMEGYVNKIVLTIENEDFKNCVYFEVFIYAQTFQRWVRSKCPTVI